MVLAELCNDPDAFPYDGYPYRVSVPAKEGSVEVVFANVEPGEYAFAALRRVFEDDFVHAGVGTVIRLP